MRCLRRTPRSRSNSRVTACREKPVSAATSDTVDAGNFDASRVCKFYGSWARKGEHSDERPHRRSAIVEAPVTLTPVSLELISAVAAEYVQAVERRAGLSVSDGNVKLQKLIGFLEHYSVSIKSAPRPIPNGHQIAIECPWVNEHSDDGPRDCVASYDGIRGFGFKCLHGHCTERHWKEFRAELQRRNPGLPPFVRRLPRMTHADIARGFVAENEDFCTVYNAPRSPIVAWVGTRWDIGDDGSRLLRKAVRTHLDELYRRYPEPEEGKKDYRLALLSAPFATNVLTEVRPLLPPVRREEFDSDVYALGLPVRFQSSEISLSSTVQSLLTVKEAALCLGVSESWVRRHILELPVVRLGRLIRIDSSQLSKQFEGRSLAQTSGIGLASIAIGKPLKPGRSIMPRYQLGSVYQAGRKQKTWYGRFREDIRKPDGTIKRRNRNIRLGTVSELPILFADIKECSAKSAGRTCERSQFIHGNGVCGACRTVGTSRRADHEAHNLEALPECVTGLSHPGIRPHANEFDQPRENSVISRKTSEMVQSEHSAEYASCAGSDARLG